MALVDYRGFRIIAMSILPINSSTIVSGSSDAGRTVHSNCDELNSKLKKAAQIVRQSVAEMRTSDIFFSWTCNLIFVELVLIALNTYTLLRT